MELLAAVVGAAISMVGVVVTMIWSNHHDDARLTREQLERARVDRRRVYADFLSLLTELDWAHTRRVEEGGESAQVGDDFVRRLRQAYAEVVLTAPNAVGVPLASASDAAAKLAEVAGADFELARNAFQQARTEFITAARQDLGVLN